jgi:hypothetical protein
MKWVVMDAPLPGLGHWDDQLKDPKVWHFNFRGPDVERLVAGRERILLDRFYNELSAILGVYALIMAAFARDTEAGLMVAISGVYFTVYLGVPATFFRTEGRSGAIDLECFLRDGLYTWTGQVRGHEAIVQILLIPIALVIAIYRDRNHLDRGFLMGWRLIRKQLQ